jgi:hypothetical protein
MEHGTEGIRCFAPVVCRNHCRYAVVHGEASRARDFEWRDDGAVERTQDELAVRGEPARILY